MILYYVLYCYQNKLLSIFLWFLFGFVFFVFISLDKWILPDNLGLFLMSEQFRSFV